MADAMVRSRGTTYHIGTTAATASSDSYVEIEKCRALDGAFGKTWSTINATTLKDVFEQHMKGVANGGTLTLAGPAYAEATDGHAAGQAALKAAADADLTEPYNFKIVASNGRTFYLKVQIMSFTVQVGNNTNLLEFRSQLLLQGQYAEAAPAGGD